MRKHAYLLVAVGSFFALAVGSWAGIVPLISDQFDQDPPGGVPAVWGTLTSLPDSSWSINVADSGSPAGNMLVDINEQNLASDTAKDITLWHQCRPVVDGTFVMQFDVMLPQTTAGFVARLNYVTSGSKANNGRSWAAAIVFEGNVPWAPGGGSGKISYQVQAFTQVWALTSATYSANTWYTVKLQCDVVNKKCQVFFGPRGGTLAEITPAGGVDFVKSGGSGSGAPPAGTQVAKINAISFASSQKTTGTPAETAGDMRIDNVEADGDQAVSAPTTVAEAKLLPADTYIQTYNLSGRIASCGTDQLGSSFFYIQDSTGGIRVRQNPLTVTVHQGDTVDISGYVDRATDNGISTQWEGEKEIHAITLSATTPTVVTVPKPVGIRNRSIGGDGFGPLDNGFPMVPGVYAADGGPGYPPPFIREAGLNNVGMYGRFWGRVTYVGAPQTATDPPIAEPYYPYFYIDDGSGVNDGSLPDGVSPQVGVRVLLRKDRADALASLLGKYVMVTGIVGAISASDLLPNQVTNNSRLIRAVEEPFTDLAGTGVYQDGDPYQDLNNNGGYDGVVVLNP